MKTKIFLVAILIAINLNAQIGIGIPNPTEMLEVDGNVIVSDKFKVDGLSEYSGNVNNFRLVAINPESPTYDGNILEFAGNQEIMPIIIQPYEIKNVYRDDLNDLNLNISTEKYVISISNFEAIPSTTNINEENLGLYKTAGGNNASDTKTFGNFKIEAFEQSNIWHVRIGSPIANTRYPSARYTYKFDVVLFPKRFFKNLGNLTYNLNASNSGAAPTTPNL